MKGASALLQRQIALITLLVGTVAIVLVSINILRLTRVLVERARMQSETVALQVASGVEAALIESPNLPPKTAINESQMTRPFAEAVVKRGVPITSLIVESEAGEPLLQVPKDAGTQTLPSFDALSKSSSLSQLKQLFLHDKPAYEYARSLEYRGQKFGRVRLGVSLEVMRAEITRSLIINLLIALAGVAAATFIAISSARLVIAPLRAITTSIEQIARDAHATESPEANSPHANIESVANRIEQIGKQIAGDRSELREARGRLQQILTSLQERLLLVSTDGRVMLASPGVEKLLGAEESAEGRPLKEVLGAQHPLVGLTERALSERETSARVTLQTSNGKPATAPLVASVQPISDRGETVGALVLLHDRETVAKLESQLDYSQRLVDFARITSGIAHEVKNPLNAIVIHLELLRSKLERYTPASDEVRPQLDILTSELQRLERVVQTFLDFTKPPRIQMRPLDINQILEETLALAAPEAETRGASIHRAFAADLPRIAGDADMLKQAFFNIIINGFQAMDSGGELRVTTARSGERHVLISITDHGRGIEPEARERIFQLYYTTKPGGHGIGLAQAFRAVQLHNGHITFESEAGTGTTFHLRFPTN
ncbi:MAG: PAS domain-containing protein [Acidobacteria bacterium]|nr:PAS domain-containing protein [Acidobacteriota bacterium]